MSNLLPCPFCGGEAELHCDLDIYAVICSKCGAWGATVDDWHEGDNAAKDAIAAWNRRADAAPVVRGEWVEAKSGVMSVWPPGQVMCSVCGQRMPSQWKKMPPYCYGCGAKMESEGKP